MLRFKYLHTLTFVGLLAAGFHATATDAPQNAVPNSAQSVKNSGLTADTFYELLVGEISARENATDLGATALLLNAARKTRSEAVYERAFEIALQTRSSNTVLEVANAWVQAFPNSADANRYQLQVLLGLNRIADTQKVIKRQFAATPVAERKAFIQQLPSYFSRVSDKKSAATAVEKALQSELSNRSIGANLWVTIGVLRMAAGDADGALDACRKAALIDPASKEPVPFAIYLLGQKIIAAEAIIHQYQQKAKEHDPELHMAYISTLWKLQRVPAAYEQVVALIQKTPSYADAWLMRGVLEMEESPPHYANAEKSFTTYLQYAQTPQAQQSQSDKRGMVEAYVHLAKIAKHQQQPEQVKKYLEQGVESAAANPDQLYELAITAEKLTLFDQMEAILRKIIALEPSYYNAYNALGYSFADRNIRLPEAKELIREALNLRPNDPFIMDSMAWVEFRSGNADDALHLLQSAFEAGQDAEVAAHLGEVLWTKGQLSQANTIWEQGLKINPNNETLRETMKRFHQKP